MTTRSNFVKSKLQKIYNSLNMSYENDSRFIKISEISNTLSNIIKGNYLFI